MVRVQLLGQLGKASSKGERIIIPSSKDVKVTVNDIVNLLMDTLGEELRQALKGSSQTVDIHSTVIILRNNVEINALKGWETEVSDEDELTLIPLIHGG